jgi:branched-chain amino acid transport system substrate-binding protein
VRRRGVVSLLGVICVAMLAVAAGQSRPSAGKTINVGWVGDKSGPTVVSQAPVLHGLEAYFRYTNEKGGVNGDKINLIEKDDQYSPAKELEATKSLVTDDKVVLVTGLGQSSGIASILPYLTSAKVPGLINQATLQSISDPFQAWMFEGNCNYSDQADVALAIMMQRLKLKTLKGKVVGVPAIEVASGQEWVAILKKRVPELGGTVVDVALPSSIVNADVQVQKLQDAKVAFILMHHSPAGGIAFLKSMAKYGMTNTPVSGSYGVTQETTFLQSPYEVSKNFYGTNCYTPPLLAKSANGKLAYATGKKYGYPEAEITTMGYALGWVNGQMIVQALKNAKGNYTGATVKAGLEKIKSLDTGGLAPNVNLSPKCHMAIRAVRPYTYNYKAKTISPIGSYAQWAKYVTNGYAAPGTCGRK